ncbi:probable G-protein coupled receptor 139 [Hypanus sabinus]|uniref:probable G-protein coupled receptor 139 n=1 Tax=Hypanus sabinus TaxID=79690 RepID=UPI0028C442E7|nr:probable G-protein coupled receptor 139 [Hypanus sabinus]
MLTIVVLFRGMCGLSKGVIRYLMAMAAAVLLVVIVDLVLMNIPIVYSEAFNFLWNIRICKVHATLLYAANDCSVWFTVMFTFDRFVAIRCQNLKAKYSTERMAVVFLGTVTALSCFKNVFWYFLLSGTYRRSSLPWPCVARDAVQLSVAWTVVEFSSHILTSVIPFVVILLLNALTIRHVLVASRGRKRLRSRDSGNCSKDPEMENRKKSIILLLVVSANFIVLWITYVVHTVWTRFICFVATIPPFSFWDLGYMLQLLSCCTNTGLYSLTQRKFR